MEPIKTQLNGLLSKVKTGTLRRAWTHADHLQLRAMFNAGRDDAYISQETGRTIAAVARQRAELGLVKYTKRKKRGQKRAAIAPTAAKASTATQEPELRLSDLLTTVRVLKHLGYRLAVARVEA